MEKIERIVRKGEKGIMIFAPYKWKKEIESNNGETDTLVGIYFKPVYVFDVSQTGGKDLPTFDAMDVEAVADGLLGDLVRGLCSRTQYLKYVSVTSQNLRLSADDVKSGRIKSVKNSVFDSDRLFGMDSAAQQGWPRYPVKPD